MTDKEWKERIANLRNQLFQLKESLREFEKWYWEWESQMYEKLGNPPVKQEGENDEETN